MLDRIKPFLPLGVFSVAIIMVLILAYPPPTEISDKNLPDSVQNVIDDNRIPKNPTIFDIQPSNTLLLGESYYKPIKPDQTPDSNLDQVINQFNNYLKNTFPGTAIPGAAVAVIYKDQIIYMNCLGVKNVGNPDPINPDTIFQIGSCSKAMSSAAVAALLDEGKMGWDDLARKYYPDPKKFSLYNPQTADKITIRDLLSHRSGLPEQAGTLHVLDFNYDFDETLYRLRFLPPEADLGTKYAYQNIMYSLAGQCSSRASDMDWGDLMQEKIFNPLKMDSTVAYFEDYLKSPNHAGTHVVDNGIAYPIPANNLDAMGPAGSISSSIRDMANWTMFQVNNGYFNGKQVVSSKSLSETHKPQMKMTDPGCWYGMGWVITKVKDKKFYVHAGSSRLSSSFVLISPSDKIGVVVIANEALVGLNFDSSTAWKFLDFYYNNKSQSPKILLNSDNDSSIKNHGLNIKNNEQTPNLPIINYSGSYYSNYYGKIKIVPLDKKNLLLYPGKNPNPITLAYVKDNTFNDVIYNKDVIFSDLMNKKPQKVTVKRWEVKGSMGTFKRISK